jgi:hypothetical protein
MLAPQPSKAWGDPLMHFAKSLGSCSHGPQVVLFLLFVSLFRGHLLHPLESSLLLVGTKCHCRTT